MDICGFTPTNSLASASFDVLNISGVEDPLINVDRLSSTDYEESYFASAIAYINDVMSIPKPRLLFIMLFQKHKHKE